MLKNMLKRLVKRSIRSNVKSKFQNKREKEINKVKFCEENIKKNINFLLDEGKSLEEIIGYNTSLLVCLTSSESIRRKYGRL